MPEVLPPIVTHTVDQDGFGLVPFSGPALWFEANANEVAANGGSGGVPGEGSSGGLRFEDMPSVRIFSAVLRITLSNSAVLTGDFVISAESGVAGPNSAAGEDSRVIFSGPLGFDGASRGVKTLRPPRSGSFGNSAIFADENMPNFMVKVELARINQSTLPSIVGGAQRDFTLSLPGLFGALQRGTGSLNIVLDVDNSNVAFGAPTGGVTTRDIENGFAAQLLLSQLITDDGDSISNRKVGHRWFVCIRCGHEYPIDRAVRDAEQRTLFVCDTGCMDELGRRDTVLLRRERKDRLWPRI